MIFVQSSGLINLGGSLMRQMERDMAMDGPSPHIVNLGKLVEEHENKIRNTLNEIYFGKSRDIVNGLRIDCKDFINSFLIGRIIFVIKSKDLSSH